MITLRPSDERGHFNRGWLKSAHTFSFAEYFDAKHVSFRSLRVINEDWIEPSSGFGNHGHKNMEIITFVIEGSVTHKDSLGNEGLISAGEIQRMTAGRGIEHSEFNSDPTGTCHLLQIWLLPREQDLAPSWQQVAWHSLPEAPQGLRLLVSHDARAGSALIHLDAEIWHGSLKPGQQATIQCQAGRGAWLQMVRGRATLGGNVKVPLINLGPGDGVAIDGAENVFVQGITAIEFLWFDLP
ncbi:MAG: pirin family protein [Proteobacteria bacterium]|nr:pirin family protein [Pseudomonadota bacterium]